MILGGELMPDIKQKQRTPIKNIKGTSNDSIISIKSPLFIVNTIAKKKPITIPNIKPHILLFLFYHTIFSSFIPN